MIYNGAQTPEIFHIFSILNGHNAEPCSSITALTYNFRGLISLSSVKVVAIDDRNSLFHYPTIAYSSLAVDSQTSGQLISQGFTRLIGRDGDLRVSDSYHFWGLYGLRGSYCWIQGFYNLLSLFHKILGISLWRQPRWKLGLKLEPAIV